MYVYVHVEHMHVKRYIRLNVSFVSGLCCAGRTGFEAGIYVNIYKYLYVRIYSICMYIYIRLYVSFVYI